jgi:hypothetical protein
MKRKVLKWCLKNEGLGVWAVLICHRICVILDSSEYGNSPLDSLKEKEYFNPNESDKHCTKIFYSHIIIRSHIMEVHNPLVSWSKIWAAASLILLQPSYSFYVSRMEEKNMFVTSQTTTALYCRL